MKIGYKLLSVKNNKMYSWINDSHISVEYKIGEKTIPKFGCGPLFVFNSLGRLREFLYNYSMFSGKIHFSNVLKKSSVHKCKYNEQKDSDTFKFDNWVSKGTSLASEVVLTKKIPFPDLL